MKSLKQTLLAVSVSAVLLLVGMVSLAPQASAVSKEKIKSCYEEWGSGASFMEGSEKHKKYMASGCHAPEACGANTVIEPGKPVTPKCANPDQAAGDTSSSSPYTGGLSTLECSVLPSGVCSAADNPELEKSGLWMILLLGFNILTAGVGIVAVGAIIFAGFLYATAQGSADQVKKSLEMIRNTAVGLLLFAAMFALMNFLVPGGLFTYSTTKKSVLAHDDKSLIKRTYL